ncbi:Allantoicase [Coemansia sp. RSA 2618]|nr:Allantoicase [Coemansia sp. RSA 2618]
MGNVQSGLPAYYNADPTNEAYTHSLSNYVDLASEAIGAKVVKASNERFGAASNLIKASSPTDTDADAWVTRRHNPENDWAVIRLGSAGTVAGFDIDTRGLTGEHASCVSIQGCRAKRAAHVDANGDIAGAEWDELLPQVEIQANSRHLLALWTATPNAYTFVRVTVHPDGGLSRVRVFGTVEPAAGDGELDLASVNAGARVVSASDETLGARDNLILPGRARTDAGATLGWKTRRSRTEDHSDWAIVRLGEAGFLTRVELDTLPYDGDQPVAFALHACFTERDDPASDPECFWYQIVPRSELDGGKLHTLDVSLNDVPFSHLKLVVFPDGGVSRLRAFGQRIKEIEQEAAREQAEASAEAVLKEELKAQKAVSDSDEQPTVEVVVTETKKVAKSVKAVAASKPKAAESSADEKDADRKKAKRADRKKKSKHEKDSGEEEQFSSRAGELIQSLTSPLPAKKRARTRSRADDDTDDASVHTVDSQAKRSRRKAKARTTPAA